MTLLSTFCCLHNRLRLKASLFLRLSGAASPRIDSTHARFSMPKRRRVPHSGTFCPEPKWTVGTALYTYRFPSEPIRRTPRVKSAPLRLTLCVTSGLIRLTLDCFFLTRSKACALSSWMRVAARCMNCLVCSVKPFLVNPSASIHLEATQRICALHSLRPTPALTLLLSAAI